MQDAPRHDRFAAHLTLVAATTLDVRRELGARLVRGELDEASELHAAWRARCENGHVARRALWPMLERAERAITRAKAGESFSF